MRTLNSNARLADVCRFQNGGTPSKSIERYFNGDIPWITGADLVGPIALQARSFITEEAVESSATNQVPAGTVLLVTRTSVGKVAIAGMSLCFSQDITALTPDAKKLSAEYLVHFLRTKQEHFTKHARGATIQGITREVVADLEIPLPPLEEQRRIAAILDQAETLRTQRRQALAHLDALTQSLFLDMFGDPVTNPQQWDVVPFGTKIATSLRNGLSPSSDGKVTAKVLTLSAITGDGFNSDAWKLGAFHSTPPVQQSVDVDDFLICRGNGNVRLVGKGYFPDRSFGDVTFPDTIIAARINVQLIAREYLQFIWNSSAVRRQVEALARTTNGTFKVNQTMLESIQIVMPPLALQQTFATRIQAIEALKATHRTALAQLDALFASLQQRAFAGEL